MDHQAGVFVPVAVCTGTAAVISVEFSSLWAPVSSTLDWLFAQISSGCERKFHALCRPSLRWNLASPRDLSLDDRCILCNEIVNTTFGSTSHEDHDVQIAVGTRVEPPQSCYIAQIPGHTNYTRSVRQLFPSITGLRFSCEMAVATTGPFQTCTFTVCNLHEFHDFATLPTQVMA